jgi:hypothetical protein
MPNLSVDEMTIREWRFLTSIRITMKNLMLTLIALTFSASVSAEWVEVGDADDTVLFLAPDTFRKAGNLRRIWEIQDFKSDVFGDGVRSLRYQSEYDCMMGNLRVLYLQAFKTQMATGEALNVPFNGKDWVPVPANSIASISLRVVCAM